MVDFKGLYALTIAMSLVAGCSSRSGKGERPREPSPTMTPAADAPSHATDPMASPADVPPSPSPSPYDESMSRTVALHYYQWDAKLKDLFSPTTAVSQLCWPAALAAELEFRRTRPYAPFNALPVVSHGETKETDETRYFATLCKTDRAAGTTVIQGVACIDKHLKSAQITPAIQVAGVDAQWQDLNLFPQGVLAERGAVLLERLRKDLTEGRSVMLLIGFYTNDDRTGSLKRERGHFVSVTGFDFDRAWNEERLTLRIMNPAVKPQGTNPEDVYERVEVRRLADSVKAPKDVTFSVHGDGFGDGSRSSLLESAISF